MMLKLMCYDYTALQKLLQAAFEGLPYIGENEIDWPAFSTVTGTHEMSCNNKTHICCTQALNDNFH